MEFNELRLIKVKVLPVFVFFLNAPWLLLFQSEPEKGAVENLSR